MAVNNLNTPGVGIQPSLIDAKGDLLVGTGNDAIDRLGVTGPTGSVLVTDAGETTGLKWVAPGSVGGLVHIKTEEGTGVTAISVNDCFTTDYNSYRIIIETSNTVNTNARLRVAGSDEAGSIYVRQQLQANNTSISGERITGTSWSIGFSHVGLIWSAAEIFYPATATNTQYIAQIQGSSGGAIRSFYNSGHTTNTVVYTGLTVTFSGSTNGKVSVLGYKI